MWCTVGYEIEYDFSRRKSIGDSKRIARNMAQTKTSNTFVSRSAPQAHPIFLLRPVQYSTPNYPRATVIRPILSSNLNLPVRPPLIPRLIRPVPVRPPPPPPLIATNAPPKPVYVQRQTPSRETSRESSSLSTLSTLSSIYEEAPRKRRFCSCLPCCRPRERQQPPQSKRSSSSPINDHRISNNKSNLPCKTRTIYILITLLFLFFLIVIILLIVLIVVRR